MGRICVVFMFLSLVAIPAYAQRVYVKGSGHAATAARANLEKDTSYKLSRDVDHIVLLVKQETWSQNFLSPATTAISMKLMSANGRLLWSKTEPIGSRSAESVVEGLLRDLSKAKPKER